MDTKQLNPYQTPKDGKPFTPESRPVFPPITLPRLVIGWVLITVGWIGIWARIREDMRSGLLIAFLSVIALVWVIQSGARRQEGSLKRRDLLVVGLVSGGTAGLVSFFKESIPSLPWIGGALVHPVALIAGWLASCGGLLRAWWKRRNNPPDDAHAEVKRG